LWIRGLVEIPYLDPYFDFVSEGSSDVGYPTYLTFIYFLTDNSILLARIIKAAIGAYMCVLVYRLATRNFDENVGRIAAIFCMLMPNLILYSGLHLKEVEMVFLSVWFVERADFVIRTKNYRFWYIFPVFLIGLSLFLFRTVLGATAIFSFITAILLSKKQVISTMKRLVLATWILMAGLYLVGGRIATEVEAVWQDKELNQAKSLEWRAIREGGNKFSNKLSNAVFAPLIFVIPFPTIVDIPGQENQQLINGGNFVKNILAFFFIYSMILLLLRRKWRDNILLLTFTMGYLIVIAMSPFAQSERFHQPALPFLLIFAALGVTSIGNKDKKLFVWYLVIIFVAIILWSWFKLAGKGLL
jgi:4-amino-4-deoxy-L-arabinose transferase-like glycosyltransferase